MKRIFLIFFSGIIGLSMLFSACEKVVYPPADESFPDDISYSTSIQPIFDANCVSCHAGQRNPDLRPDGSHASLMNGYVNTADPAASKIMTILNGSHNSRASQSEKNLILGWITQGALDN